jgi:hypothetical protein
VDNQKMQMGTQQENITYKQKMPNVPYYFADMDVSLTWFNAFAKSNKLTFTYDNQYLHSFSYYSSAVVGNNSDYMVPFTVKYAFISEADKPSKQLINSK